METNPAQRDREVPEAQLSCANRDTALNAQDDVSQPLQPLQPLRFEVCAGSRCPIEDTLNVVAGRWKTIILWWLQGGELRFGELRRLIPSVSPKMLTQQLRQMEKEGLVEREVFAQVPPKVIYSLTERGKSLQPVLQSLYDWSAAQATK